MNSSTQVQSHTAELPELAAIQVMIDVYALRLARAYVAKDDAAAEEIRLHILGSYDGDNALHIIGQRASDMILSGIVK